MKVRPSLLILFGGAVVAAGSARAETTTQPLGKPKPYRTEATVAAVRRAIDLPGAKPPVAPIFIRTDPLASAVLPRTAVDHRFAPKDVVGSLGFLCGREPGHNDTGSAAAFGSDPHGRFVGAKLSYAF